MINVGGQAIDLLLDVSTQKILIFHRYLKITLYNVT